MALKNCFTVLCILGFLSLTHGVANAQWTHTVAWPAQSNQDIPFTGTGPNWASWHAELMAVSGVAPMEIIVSLETDADTCNGGGIFAGEYKLSEYAPGEKDPNWIQGTALRSSINQGAAIVNFAGF